MRKLNDSTFTADHKNIEAVVGDEKQADFYPRLKIKKWDNEVNFSLGLIGNEGTHRQEGDKEVYETDTLKAEFYPVSPRVKTFNSTAIRYINSGAMTPLEIAARYELDREIQWQKQTVEVHWSDRPAMMYYGYYHADSYLDLRKLGDLPEIRLAASIKNNPMYMDSGLPLIDVHYDEKRDDLTKVTESLIQAVTEVVEKRGVAVTRKGGKLYFEHKEKLVKFFSVAPIDGHFYAYVNLSCDYNKAYDYYIDGLAGSDMRDPVAFGLNAVIDVDHSIMDKIVTRYAELYSLPLETSSYTRKETQRIQDLLPVHSDMDWVRTAKRNDVYYSGRDRPDDGFEFAIHLKTKPVSNIVPLTIETKGLDFYYQGELSKEDALKSYRPSYVIGSIVAYHKTKQGNQYQSGKAFHIYRPWAVDATGEKVWCEFSPDWNGVGGLDITVPQNFLDNATYPVTIDPTFGYTTVGASAANLDQSTATETIHALIETGAVGAVSSITANIATVVATGTGHVFKFALYRASDGVKIAETSQQTDTTNVTQSWRTLNTTTNPSISAVSYWIAAWGQANGANAYDLVSLYYDTVASAGLNKSLAYGAWPNPLSGTTGNNNRYSIYATYTITSIGNFFMLMR